MKILHMNWNESETRNRQEKNIVEILELYLLHKIKTKKNR